MQLSLSQASQILGKSHDEVLFMVQEKRLKVIQLQDKEIKYLADGRVEFNDEQSDPSWVFDFDEVIRAKKELDEGLDGQIRSIMES